jgi:hypothetical protein
MNRRQMITGAAAMSAVLSSSARATGADRSFLEITTWRLHNSDEDQAKRVSDYLEGGLFPALTRAGARPIAAFATLIGPDAPTLFSIAEYTSLGSMQEVLSHLGSDAEYNKASQTEGSGPGMPFVTMESSLFHNLSVLPQAVLPTDASSRPARIFELRTYQSQSMTARQKKAGMFNDGEIGVFQRLGMRPVFIGESVVGPRQPNITYMLSFDDLEGRETHWKTFGSDPEWKKISAPAELKDSQIVANISNIILRPLAFSPMR